MTTYRDQNAPVHTYSMCGTVATLFNIYNYNLGATLIPLEITE